MRLFARWFPAIAPHLRRGRRGESAAARHLRRAGYRVLGRNLKTPAGEIDILCIAPDGRTIVVGEVKTAQNAPDAHRLSATQARTLVNAANTLVRANGWEDRPVRIDLLLVRDGERHPTVEHLVDVVDAKGRRGR